MNLGLRLHQMSECRGGSVAIVFALCAVLLIFAAGAALDYAAAASSRASLQEALDAAALAALRDTTADVGERIRDAEKMFAANYRSPCAAPVVSNVSAVSATVTADCPRETALLRVVGIRTLDVSGSATARRSAGGGMPLCLLALDPSMSRAVEGSGGTEWVANDCVVHVNSSNVGAVNLSGGSSIDSGRNCFVGGVSQGYSNIRPAPEASCSPFADPFAGLTRPSVGPCDYTNFSANTPTTLSPGVYCGGLTLQNSVFTLNPGLYVIKDGAFVSTGGDAISGTGVTFFLTGAGVGLNWSGGGTYNFRAMTTGPLAGFVVYSDPDAVVTAKSVMSGGGATRYEGVLYFPNQKVEISGSGSTAAPSPFTAFVAKNFLFSGGSQLRINFDRDATAVPVPNGLYASAGQARIVE